MKNNLKSGIIKILIVNVLNLVVTLITNFVLPKHLSTETYAAIKSYQFYINYIGILHLGYADGMYLKYGGKSYTEIDTRVFKRELSTLRIFQFIMCFAATVVALFMRDLVMVLVALSILPYNMFVGYKTIFQAIGDFDSYSKAINASTVILFLINMVSLFVLHIDKMQVYLYGYFVCYVLIWIALEYRISKTMCQEAKEYVVFDVKYFSENIRSGILLMLGNFSSIILTGMDRWFIKFLMDTVAFAEYSFAVSIENFINFAVTPVSTTLYNYFCGSVTNQQIKQVRNLVSVFSAFLITAAFPAKFILETYLNKYIAAADVIFYLFVGQFFFIQVKSIYINLYKAQRRQTVYFIKLSLIVLLGAVFNAVLYMLMKSKEAFAIGTMLTACVWFVLSVMDFPTLKIESRQWAYLLTIPVLFLLLGRFKATVGMILYLLAVAILTYIFMRKEFDWGIAYIQRGVKTVRAYKGENINE